MELKPNCFYHLYNRSNAREPIFRCEDNYLFFLKKFKTRFRKSLKVVSYCLMPTHFHFLVQITTEEISELKRNIGIHLSSYTKAYNKLHNRHGSLFQQHTKAKIVDDRTYLLVLINYIHQNPIRNNLVEDLCDWPFSSYRDLAGLRKGTLPDRSIIDQNFRTTQEFIDSSKMLVDEVKRKYWVWFIFHDWWSPLPKWPPS